MQTNADGKAYVLVPGDKKDKPVTKAVQAGVSDGGYVQITSGLAEGDIVLMPATVTDMTSGSFTPVEK